MEFKVNDPVKISDNIHQVKEKQKGHGEWTDNMKSVSYHYLCIIFLKVKVKQNVMDWLIDWLIGV